MVSPLQASIDFLKGFGFFDIVLPFILVFAIIYALLDKTKILGKEDKKNVNALVAFAIGLFVVAATNVVTILRDALPLITLVLVVLLSFMLLVGTFHGDKEFSYFTESKFWRWFLSIVLLISVLFIFGNFVETDSGETWLEVFWDFVNDDFTSGPVVSSIVFLLIIVFVVYFISYSKKEGGS